MPVLGLATALAMGVLDDGWLVTSIGLTGQVNRFITELKLTPVQLLIVVVLSNGMVLMGIPPTVQQAVQGLMIIAAVAMSTDRKLLSIVK